MIGYWIDSLLVTLALLTVSTGFPLLALRKAWAGCPVECRWWIRIILGCSVTATFGLLWSDFIMRSAWTALASLLLIWVLIGWAVRHTSFSATPQPKKSDMGWLVVLLAGALFYRLIHPVQHSYLGQSDAYAHLTFIKEIIAQGHLRNYMYPTGLHWIMALPTLLFHLDPYIVARYGGAFWGGLLVWGTYMLIRSVSGPRDARLSAFLVGMCPLFILLIKTGVGVFSNQMGLALMPAILWSYFHTLRDRPDQERKRAAVLLGAFCAGLVSSVPLLLIQVALFVALERGLAFLFTSDRKRVVASGGLVVISLLPAAFLFCAHFLFRPVSNLPGMATAMTGTDTSGFRGGLPIQMACDFLSVKHWGFGLSLFSLAGLLLLLFFIGSAVYALHRKQIGLQVISVFGTLLALQTMTGLFEFSRYQRSGWLLMAAAAWGVPLIMIPIDRWIPPRIKQAGMVAFIGLSLIGATQVIPQHPALLSTEEEELVDLSRSLSQQAMENRSMHIPFSFSPTPDRTRELPLNPSQPVTLVQRSMSTSGKDYWQISTAVAAPRSPALFHYVETLDDLPCLTTETGMQWLFLLDQEKALSLHDMGAFSEVDPKHALQFSMIQQRLLMPIQWLRQQVREAENGGWASFRVDLDHGGELILLSPTSSRSVPHEEEDPAAGGTP